jgi:hypothetical protein
VCWGTGEQLALLIERQTELKSSSEFENLRGWELGETVGPVKGKNAKMN